MVLHQDRLKLRSTQIFGSDRISQSITRHPPTSACTSSNPLDKPERRHQMPRLLQWFVPLSWIHLSPSDEHHRRYTRMHFASGSDPWVPQPAARVGVEHRLSCLGLVGRRQRACWMFQVRKKFLVPIWCVKKGFDIFVLGEILNITFHSSSYRKSSSRCLQP